MVCEMRSKSGSGRGGVFDGGIVSQWGYDFRLVVENQAGLYSSAAPFRHRNYAALSTTSRGL
jgi:hypothetical protein